MHKIRSEIFDLILVDLNYTRDTTSGAEGIDLLSSLEKQGNTTPVMVMTAWSSFDLAVEAMRRGACDFIQKPWDNDRLVAAIRKQAESERRARVRARDRGQRAAEALPAQAARACERSITPAIACPRAKSAATTTTSSRSPTTARLCAGRRLGQGRARRAADGQPAGQLPQPVAGRAAASVRRARDGQQSLLRLDRRRAFRDALLRHLRRPHAPHPLRELRARARRCCCAPRARSRSWTRPPRCSARSPVGSARKRRSICGRGDTMLVYSDGVTEAGIEHGDEFGDDRLEQVLRENAALPRDALVQKVIDEVSTFSGASRSDDVTVVALRGM